MVEATEASVVPEEVRRLRLEPGDRFIVRVRDTWRDYQVREYGDWLKAHFPDNEALIIVGEEIAVETTAPVGSVAMSDEEMDRLADKICERMCRQLRQAAMVAAPGARIQT